MKLHPNLTLKKLCYFAVTSLVGMVVVVGGTYILTDKMGLWYVSSTVITGGVAFVIKFVMSAVWAFSG